MGFKDRSRRLARESYWEDHDRDSYECPDCGRSEDEIRGSFEVHHKNGEPLDNRPENRVALCRVCHNLREDKKPSIKEIEYLRSQVSGADDTPDNTVSGTPSVYLAGVMDYDHGTHGDWRASIGDRAARGEYRYNGDERVSLNSPSEVNLCHGIGRVAGVAGKDMQMVDDSDAIVAYFEKHEQVGTMTELCYAVAKGKNALVLFKKNLVPWIYNEKCPLETIQHGVEMNEASPVYWFLINFLTGDGWNGLDGDIKLMVVESKDEVGTVFRNWDWLNKQSSDISEEGGNSTAPLPKNNLNEYNDCDNCSYNGLAALEARPGMPVKVCPECGETMGMD